MRPIRSLALAAVLGTLLVPAARAGTSLEFTVKTVQGPTIAHPHPPAGGVGDSYVSSLRLVNAGIAQFGKGRRSQIGTMEFTYTVRKQCTSFGKTCVSTADIDSVTTLPDGTVEAAGKAISISQTTIVIPVVGGTGRYTGASGTVSISPTSTKFSTYRLRLP